MRCHIGISLKHIAKFIDGKKYLRKKGFYNVMFFFTSIDCLTRNISLIFLIILVICYINDSFGIIFKIIAIFLIITQFSLCTYLIYKKFKTNRMFKSSGTHTVKFYLIVLFASIVSTIISLSSNG